MSETLVKYSNSFMLLPEDLREVHLRDRIFMQQEVAGLLAASTDLDDVFEGILRIVCRNRPWVIGGYWEPDPSHDYFRCRIIHSESDAGMEEFIVKTRELRLRPGEGMLGRVAKTQLPEWIEDVREYPGFFRGREAEAGGLVSGVAFSVALEGEVYGVFEFYSQVPWEHDPEFLDLFQALSLQLTQLLIKKKMERALQTQVRRNLQFQKSRAIERIAGGVAHEFNNQLTVVIGYMEMLLANPIPKSDSERAILEEVKSAGEKMSVRTRQLLAYTGQQMFNISDVDVNERLKRSESALRQMARLDTELEVSTNSRNPWVSIDPEQLDHAVHNLVSNAFESLSPGGKVVVETRNANQGAFVVISVRDTGRGMEKAELEQILDPYYTTKAFGNNNGLGLPIVNGIVQQSGGFLQISSIKGEGTVFEIWLPTRSKATSGSFPEIA